VLVVLISSCWLLALVLGVALCRAAASADDATSQDRQTARQVSRRPHRRPPLSDTSTRPSQMLALERLSHEATERLRLLHRSDLRVVQGSTIPVGRSQVEKIDSGRTESGVWRLAMGLAVVIAASDALLGRSVVLLALLSLSPFCALLTARWTRTALAGTWAAVLGVPLGVPDGIWGSSEYLAMLGIVLAASVLSTAAAVILQRRALA
jgi:hypothetical protein